MVLKMHIQLHIQVLNQAQTDFHKKKKQEKGVLTFNSPFYGKFFTKLLEMFSYASADWSGPEADIT